MSLMNSEIKVECTRFKVKKGMEKTVDEWIKFLNDNMEEVLLTLDGEKMYAETIFREKIDEEEYLYWYCVQGEGGIDVRESDSWIDIKHLEYWEKCIDKSFGKVDLTTEVVMIPNRIRESMI